MHRKCGFSCFQTLNWISTASALIRITFVIPTLDQSGAERQLCLLATELAQTADVSVIALNRGGFYATQLHDAGISVHVLGKRFRFDPLTFVRLRSLLRKSRPNIIQSFLFSANTYVRLPGIRPGGSKVIVSERCVDSWKSGWQLTADRRLVQRMDAMTANSNSVADFYRTKVGVPHNLINVISNGIPLRPQKTVPAADQTLRRELRVSENTKLVGFVGRLAAQKCLKDLVWAFQLLHQVVENVRLVFIGDGPERDNLAELLTSFGCRDKAHFLGHRDDAQQLMPQLDAFCLPSSFEGMSNSLMEAMASGVPAVVSNISANLELIQHERTGLVFPLGNGPEITKSLKRILDDDAFAKNLASGAQKHIQQQHSVELMIQKHLDLYNRLTS